MLKVKFLRPGAKAPTVAHPGEDLGYDIYAAETINFAPRGCAVVPTAIAIEMMADGGESLGAILRDKSSVASRRLIIAAGVIDAGYRGEIKVLMENLSDAAAEVRAGDKIANLIPYPVLTGAVEVVDELAVSNRQARGFGSSGRR